MARAKKAQPSEVSASVDRFLADIAAIIRRHAERVVAEVLARRGLVPSSGGPGKLRKAKGAGKRASRAAAEAAPTSRRAPQQLSLF